MTEPLRHNSNGVPIRSNREWRERAQAAELMLDNIRNAFPSVIELLLQINSSDRDRLIKANELNTLYASTSYDARERMVRGND